MAVTGRVRTNVSPFSFHCFVLPSLLSLSLAFSPPTVFTLVCPLLHLPSLPVCLSLLFLLPVPCALARAALCPMWALPSRSPPTPTSASSRSQCLPAGSAALRLPLRWCSLPAAQSLARDSAARRPGAPMRQGTGMTAGETSGRRWACCARHPSPRLRAPAGRGCGWTPGYCSFARLPACLPASICCTGTPVPPASYLPPFTPAQSGPQRERGAGYRPRGLGPPHTCFSISSLHRL